MRTALPALALIVPLAAVSAAPPPKPVPAPPPVSRSLAPSDAGACLMPTVTFAGEAQGGTRVRKLGELPPANAYLAVERHVGGCPEPAVVRTGIGR